jgi:mitogen-activated protein kinase kinase kinase
MLTVEEVTEDLERRRLSRASWSADLSGLVAADTSGDSTESDAAASSNLGISDDTLGEDVLEDNIILEEDEEQDEDESDEEDVEEEEGDEDDEVAEAEEAEKKEAEAADVPQTVTTTTKKSTFRWVKGTLIGSGAFGQVYLGMNARNGSFMAVKQVELPTGKSQNEERKKGMLSALEREIELLKIMHHENIVQYLGESTRVDGLKGAELRLCYTDSHSDDKHLYIFLEYVPGGSVAHILANLGAFEEALVRTFCKQILAGLAYLHENDIVHRDIKGANILVDNRGTVKISDFGISKKVEENLLTGGSRLNRPSLQGSVFWMAPEVVKQTSYTAKADIWSLGCLIVEMVTGQHPWFELTQMQAIFKVRLVHESQPLGLRY